MTTMTALSPATGSILAVCVDPEVAAEYGDRAEILAEELVLTDKQARVFAMLSRDGHRVVTAAGDEGAWRFIVAAPGFDEGDYGRIFNTETVRVSADGGFRVLEPRS